MKLNFGFSYRMHRDPCHREPYKVNSPSPPCRIQHLKILYNVLVSARVLYATQKRTSPSLP